jgi:hypothetical protein
VARQKIRPKRWFEAATSTVQFGVLRATKEAGKLGKGTVQQLLYSFVTPADTQRTKNREHSRSYSLSKNPF